MERLTPVGLRDKVGDAQGVYPPNLSHVNPPSGVTRCDLSQVVTVSRLNWPFLVGLVICVAVSALAWGLLAFAGWSLTR